MKGMHPVEVVAGTSGWALIFADEKSLANLIRNLQKMKKYKAQKGSLPYPAIISFAGDEDSEDVHYLFMESLKSRYMKRKSKTRRLRR